MEPPATATKRSSRQLIFDRRYGWGVDEWKDPSEEALAGGRGMFCIVPLAKTVVQAASQSANSAVKVMDSAFLFPPQVLKTNVGNELQKWAASVMRRQGTQNE
ncbi:PREDICTED: uncharacterized protein LOC104807782 [Tarenaya hassleriana]|uniref:uncharacterized protein LOC104807782 n=1 Tax=Tarenaya hassleriana TaxID=28532 RepID=UPI00053C7B65|nr:PREDICTED: uncharacterized protein LOC104807782 [Tarenaya hassleriana]